jgi:hypothetical protein
MLNRVKFLIAFLISNIREIIQWHSLELSIMVWKYVQLVYISKCAIRITLSIKSPHLKLFYYLFAI